MFVLRFPFDSVLRRADSVASLPVVRLQVAAANQINDISNFFPSLWGRLTVLTVLCLRELRCFQSRCQLPFPCVRCPPSLAVLDFRDKKHSWPESRNRAACAFPHHTTGPAFGPVLRDARWDAGCSALGFQPLVLWVRLGLPGRILWPQSTVFAHCTVQKQK